jgi:F420-dependent oxidoreductase-like protein
VKLAVSVGYSGAGLDLPLAKVLRAEALNYHSAWTAETYGSDAVTPLAFLAARTDKIKLGTAIMQLAGRAPAMAAMQMATLDALSDGRAIAGVGVSGPQIVEGWYGQPWGRPYYRIRDYVEIMRKVFTRERPVEHAGREFSLPYTGQGALGIGKPLKSILHPRPDLPIWLGCGTETNVRLAGQVADGLIPLGFVPSTSCDFQAWIQEGLVRAGSGKSMANFEVFVPMSVSVTNDVQAALRLLKPNIALYVGGMGHRDKNFHYDAMVRRGYADAAARIQELFLAGRYESAADAVPDEYCDEGALVGPAERITARYSAWRDTIATGIIVRGDLQAIEVMAEVVSAHPDG